MCKHNALLCFFKFHCKRETQTQTAVQTEALITDLRRLK